jgi:opacity protein-like surface antigen
MQFKNISRFVVAAVFATALLRPAAASAQRLDSPYRFITQKQHVDAFGAYFDPSHGRLGAGPNSGYGGGLRWGMAISGPLAIELELAYAPLTRPVVDTAFNADSSHVVKGQADMNMMTALANVRFNLTGARTWHSLQPFLLFGAGLATNFSKENGADSLVVRDARFGFGTSFAGNVGAGLEYFVSPRIAARLDGGATLWKLKAPNAFILKGPGVIPASEWERNLKMTAGLSLHF